MVIASPRPRQTRVSRAAFLMTELMVALAIIVLAVMPLAGLYLHENRLARACYHRAAAMEVVDGEMEALLAGSWKAHAPGTSEYPLPESIRSSLPPGHLRLTRDAKRLTLEWTPDRPHDGGTVVRIAKYQ
jgi:hypothetical protein